MQILFALVIFVIIASSVQAFYNPGTFAKIGGLGRCMLEMRERKCDLSGTRRNSKCMTVSKSNAHNHKVQNVNLQTKKLWWEEGNKFVRIRISARTLKTVQKNGLNATAKKYGVDLNKFSLSSGTAPSSAAVLDA